MTIKEFSRLCRCNPQTLRYYDRISLLKPAGVDKYSGYRLYEENQAFDFIKIKNLQAAGFTIREIKKLLDKDNSAVFAAFNEKIAEQERKLEKIRAIQKSYQTEMNQMEKTIKELSEKVTKAMREYDPKEEFGIDGAEYQRVIESVGDFFREIASNCGADNLEFSDGSRGEPDENGRDFLNSPNYEKVYEKHGWRHFKDFEGEIPDLQAGEEYGLYFELDGDRAASMPFANIVLNLMLARNPGKKLNLGCTAAPSKDGENHFWLMRLKH